MKILVLVLTFSLVCPAIEVDPITKGDPAPKDGYFVDKENLKQMRQINEDKKRLEKQNIKLKDLSTLNEERIDVYKDRASQAEREVSKEKFKGNIKIIGGFVLGILATSLAVFAAKKVVN